MLDEPSASAVARPMPIPMPLALGIGCVCAARTAAQAPTTRAQCSPVITCACPPSVTRKMTGDKFSMRCPTTTAGEPMSKPVRAPHCRAMLNSLAPRRPKRDALSPPPAAWCCGRPPAGSPPLPVRARALLSPAKEVGPAPDCPPPGLLAALLHLLLPGWLPPAWCGRPG